MSTIEVHLKFLTYPYTEVRDETLNMSKSTLPPKHVPRRGWQLLWAFQMLGYGGTNKTPSFDIYIAFQENSDNFEKKPRVHWSSGFVKTVQ